MKKSIIAHFSEGGGQLESKTRIAQGFSESNHSQAGKIIPSPLAGEGAHRAGEGCKAFTLAEVFSPHSADKRKAAFTLAEVLITLGIIGVVAALTLPTLITNYREKQRVTQVKKVYSLLQNAFLMAVEKHGDADSWDLAITSKGDKDENGNYIILDQSGQTKFLSYLAENLNVQKNTTTLKINDYTLDGTKGTGDQERPPEHYLKLNDGTIIYAGWVNPTYADIGVYFPGCEKQGCRHGKDIFYFEMYFKNNKGAVPLGMGKKFNLNDYCSRNNNGNRLNGRYCTSWIIQNENMDYLHCDDLDWNTKTKCK